jgi:predicted molibdopterin-dependent oxidoreductase YjgC
MTAVSPPARLVEITVNGEPTRVKEGASLLDACRSAGVDTPTLCYLENLTPVNACRLCVVEVEASRTLVPACSRRVEAGMVLNTQSERVYRARRLVLELLASSVDLSLAGTRAADGGLARYLEEYGASPVRFERDGGAPTETVDQPVTVDNDLYVRDYAKCVLCYKCVEACGVDAQNTFAISVAGRGFDAHISTEFAVALPDSACVYCGNCVGVCPTGALMFKSERDMRDAGTWDESAQQITRTVCPYCGVGCNLDVHAQGNEIVKVTSPMDHSVTSGHLCVKGRFGWQFVQNRERAGDPQSPVEGRRAE